MAVAYTDTLGFNKGSSVPNANTAKVRIERIELDFAAIVAARVAAGATALAATDSLAVLHVPALTQVISSGAHVTSAETVNTTATFDTGDTEDPNGYVAALASNAIAGASDTTLGLKNHQAADVLTVTLGTAAPTDAVLVVWAVLADIS